MKTAILGIVLTSAICVGADQPATKKPPVGVPVDAKLFNGKWYRVYLEAVSWKTAKSKCDRIGGQLAIVPDAPTQAFIRKFSNNLMLWLGGYEKVEGLWKWVDDTPFDYTSWVPGEPDNNGHTLNMLCTWKGDWGDAANTSDNIVGYICEWKEN
jgi:hypothetical protein